jgi:hypothetical protein
MTNNESFNKSILNICSFCQKYDKNSPISAGSATANAVRRDLQNLAEDLFSSLNEIYDASKELQATFSRGSGTFPKVPWISVLPKGKKVSNSISATMCFARTGKGMVLGIMTPAGYSLESLPSINRTEMSTYLDVDGSAKTRYNNLFMNPKEFLLPEISKESIVKHLLDSVQIMSKLKNGDSL